MYKFTNVNQALIGMSQRILRDGRWRKVRGMNCLEIPNPVIIEISNPTDRYVAVPGRKWNKYLPFAESLWLALGLNDLDALPGHYVKNLYNYSDDGRTWRGGYGPRIRAFSGIATDYDISHPSCRHIISGFIGTTDQLRYVIESLQRDINTRQAIIQIGDPVKDDFDEKDNLKVTKDYPCSRTLQFMVVDGRLNCTLYIRSNDIVYGMSGVNIFNFTWMQEYISNIIGVPIGKYYHIVNNLHVYEEFLDKVKEFAAYNVKDFVTAGPWHYKTPIKSLQEFDRLIEGLYNYEQLVRRGESEEQISFNNDMFNDWANVFLYHKIKDKNPHFVNPYLKQLFK